MSLAIVATRSGIKKSTVHRMLTGNQKVDYGHLQALRRALGEGMPPQEMIEREASRRAKRIVSLVQGTMGLEAQGLEEEQLSGMYEKAFLKLIHGPRRRIWQHDIMGPS
jgi:hypothetical protein